MLHYSDGDIHARVRRGVPFKVIAQLNNCQVSEVKDAYDRYEAFLKQRDKDYKKQLRIFTKNQSQHKKVDLYHRQETDVNIVNEPVGSCMKQENRKQSKKRTVYKYDVREEALITRKLAEGSSVKEVYSELFDSDSENSPTLKAFYNKCRRLLNK